MLLREFEWDILLVFGFQIPAIKNTRYYHEFGPGVAQWLRRCAASRKVPGSIPGRVTGDFFRDPGSTQPFEMSTRIFLGVKTAGA
jgi:hypothetical protein